MRSVCDRKCELCRGVGASCRGGGLLSRGLARGGCYDMGCGLGGGSRRISLFGGGSRWICTCLIGWRPVGSKERAPRATMAATRRTTERGGRWCGF